MFHAFILIVFISTIFQTSMKLSPSEKRGNFEELSVLTYESNYCTKCLLVQVSCLHGQNNIVAVVTNIPYDQ